MAQDSNEETIKLSPEDVVLNFSREDLELVGSFQVQLIDQENILNSDRESEAYDFGRYISTGVIERERSCRSKTTIDLESGQICVTGDFAIGSFIAEQDLVARSRGALLKKMSVTKNLSELVGSIFAKLRAMLLHRRKVRK